jgi:EmrB/QacA subfamily drug resistance transporter
MSNVTSPAKTRNRWIGLIFIAMAISLVIIDGTIVNTIFPTVIDALKLTSTQVQWVQESYVLVFASLLLVWGSIADRYGRKRMLVLGILIFVASSVWAGFAVDPNALIAARVVQGIGGSMVLPTTLSLVNANFQGKERGIAFAVWGATIGGMVAIGPVIGGLLATYKTIFAIDGWRWAFVVNLPLGILVVAGLLWWVKESKAAQRVGGIDFFGAFLSVLMFVFLVFGLIEGRAFGWWTASTKNVFGIGDFKWPTDGISIIPVSLALAVVFGTCFVLWERAREKAHKNVILDLDLFKITSFRNGSIAALIISMGEFGILFAIPLWLQNIKGLTPVDSGMVLLWLAGGSFVASGVGGAMSGKLAPAVAVRMGVGLELVGALGIATLVQASSSWWLLAPFLFIYGIGVGLATAQLTGVIMVDVPFDKLGQGSGSQSTVRQVGSALGIAVLGTALFSFTQISLESKLTDLKVAESSQTLLVDGVVDSAGGIIPGLDKLLVDQFHTPEAQAAKIVTASKEAFTDGAKASSLAAAFFLLLGLGATMRLTSRKHGEGLKSE